METGEPVFPVFTAPRAEMRLRRDNLGVLSATGIDEADVLCLDDLPLEELLRTGRLSLTLVDHNELSPRQEALAGSVVAIADHHFDAGLYTETVRPANRTVVFPLGSTCSIVTELLLATSSPLLQDGAATLLLASSIVVDTGNLLDEGKMTPRDRQALAALEKSLGPERALFGGVAPETWLQQLTAWRSDTTGFSLLDVLKKDPKYARAGSEIFAVAMIRRTLASVTADGDAAEQEKLLAAMEAFLRQESKVGSLFVLLWGRTRRPRDAIGCAEAAQRLQPRLERSLAQPGHVFGGRELRGAPGRPGALVGHSARRPRQAVRPFALRRLGDQPETKTVYALSRRVFQEAASIVTAIEVVRRQRSREFASCQLFIHEWSGLACKLVYYFVASTGLLNKYLHTISCSQDVGDIWDVILTECHLILTAPGP